MNTRMIHQEPAAGSNPIVSMRAAAVMVGLVALIGVAGFAGWFANGDALFWSLLQAGFAWCM